MQSSLETGEMFEEKKKKDTGMDLEIIQILSHGPIPR